MLTLQKIWLYGGWFYLSLLLAIFLSYSLGQVFKKPILILGLLFAFFFSAKSFLKNFESLPNFWLDFRLSVAQKINKDSFEQDKFSKEIKAVLPPEATGCVYKSWDIPTRFLIQELYPFVFVPKDINQPASDCQYLISQFEPINTSSHRLIFSSEKGYLYQKKDE